MGAIKDRNGMDLTEAEDIKRGGKNTQKNYIKKDLHDPYNHNGVITHLEPDILECKVKWALGSITSNILPASIGSSKKQELVEVMEFQVRYFKSLKMML